MVTRVEIELRKPSMKGKFDDVYIHIVKENEITISTNINFDFNPLFGFTRDKESVAFDFLFFSVLIYNIDRFVNRHNYSLEGWTRDIEVVNMPILHLSEFLSIKEQMDGAISFLTGDIWNINYVQSEGLLYDPPKRIKDWSNLNEFQKVCLFSGGLDSLIGAIDELEGIQNGKILLISHKDLGKEGVDQDSILTKFKNQQLFNGKYDQIQTSVGIGRKKTGLKFDLEATFRSRSLLFIGMGIYVANKIGPNIPLIIPENGTIALNIPLMPSRRSACSTRTTHPAFLNRLQIILSEIGIKNQMHNPYEFKTKGEMVEETNNKMILNQLIDLSCSCAKRSHTYFWEAEKEKISKYNIHHCGMCLPCIYRRVSLHLNGLDKNADIHYGTDVFDEKAFDIDNMKLKSPRDFRTLLEFINKKPTIELIEKELLINGMNDVTSIGKYASVVERTIKQIIEWINSSQNENIKRKAGLR